MEKINDIDEILETEVSTKGIESSKENKKNAKEIRRYKDFQVDYLRLFEEEYDSNGNLVSNRPVDISEVLKKCSQVSVEKRIKNHKGEVIRLQDIKKLNNLADNLRECSNLWILHFIRIKLSILSGVADSNGSFSETLLNQKLNANQHLAESTGCLYDADKELLIIARNRDGVPPSAILEYIRMISKNKNITYSIIPNETSGKSQNTNIYRKLIVGMKDVDKMTKKDFKLLEKIPAVSRAIKGFNGYGYCNIKIELSMGDSPKNVGMNTEKLKDTSMKLMESGLSNLNKLEISSKEDLETTIETVDLLNNKIKDSFKVGFTRTEPILFSDIHYNLLDSYNRKKEITDKKIT